MNVQGLDLLSNAKTLIPYELRPVEVKESWGQSFLSTKEFFAVLGSIVISLGSGLLLYFSFYIALILNAVETFERRPENEGPKRIIGSYRRSIRHVLSSFGLSYFISGMMTFLWTTLLAYFGRWALTKWAVPLLPVNSTSFTNIGAPQAIFSFLLEPFNILFTHKILTTSQFSPWGTMRRLYKSQALYTTLIYIESIRMGISALQDSLLVKDRYQHYSQPFATAFAYLCLILLRVLLVSRAHVALLPPSTTTTVDISPNSPQTPIGTQLGRVILRTLWMFRLSAVYCLLGVLHLVGSLLAIIFASGQREKVLGWIYSFGASKQSAQPPIPMQDPGFMMGYDTRFEHSHH